MPYLLNLVYLLLILVALPWLAYQAVRKGKYREGFGEKLLGRVPPRESEGTCVWLHAVSVGEVNLLATLIDHFARNRPDCECVVSTTTKTGLALARKKYPHLAVFYCPLDFTWAVRTAVRRVRPNLLVLAELELWPNLVRAARESGARVAVINGRLSEHSFRGYCRIRPLVARLLAEIDLLAVQDDAYADRFRRLGAPAQAVRVTGSMKYDGAETDRDNPTTRRLRRLAGLADDDVILLAGSTQEPEESLCLAAYRQLCGTWPQLRLILVPRHPDRFPAVARLLDDSGLAWQRRTDLEHEGPNPEARVLLVDVVGELGAWWGTAGIAYVGGSMGTRGGQNMIEPAAYGAAVCFGPNTRNFRDIVATMLAQDAAMVVHDGEQLAGFVRRCLEAPEEAAALGDRARALVARQLGATERTFRLLAALLDDNDTRHDTGAVAAA
ncbi:MAG TPA: 3-deoxy-D-manno-octulosonic acid transferase [Thermoguttaceae bacterium]|nr:3-deoxy-D-manno-octulosonic acid transferase [Thermoguttaceae bacterium]